MTCSTVAPARRRARRGSSRDDGLHERPSTRSSWTRRARSRSPTSIAVGTSARNLVLLGDPNQLPQVSQGAQPDEAKASVLQHLLGEDDDRAAGPRDLPRATRGACVRSSARSPPRRTTRAGSATRTRTRAADARGGERARSAARSEHAGRSQSRGRRRTRSRPRSARSSGRRSRTTTARRGRWPSTTSSSSRRTTRRCATLRPARPGGVRVGTVDKFQGQEAPVVIVSMASSTAEDAPRGHRVRLQPAPGQRRDVAGAVPRRARLLAAAARRGLQDGRADAARQRGLPLRRARPEALA